MIELFCGLIIGAVMGLTGAGGALVAIPLFMQFMNQSLKEASMYSLVAVVVASLLNFLAQKIHTKYTTGIVIIASSAVGSFITAPFKELISSFWIGVILSGISLYALYSVWYPIKIKEEHLGKSHENNFVSLIVGLILGAVTTFTGLGGGVLMLPVLLGIYRFTRPQAVATSLFAVGLSSLSSLIIQISRGATFEINAGFAYLLVGILLAAYGLRKYSRHLKAAVLLRLQQIIFTIVVLLALSKILSL